MHGVFRVLAHQTSSISMSGQPSLQRPGGRARNACDLCRRKKVRKRIQNECVLQIPQVEFYGYEALMLKDTTRFAVTTPNQPVRHAPWEVYNAPSQNIPAWCEKAYGSKYRCNSHSSTLTGILVNSSMPQHEYENWKPSWLFGTSLPIPARESELVLTNVQTTHGLPCSL